MKFGRNSPAAKIFDEDDPMSTGFMTADFVTLKMSGQE
jgi:hypothetical protein